MNLTVYAEECSEGVRIYRDAAKASHFCTFSRSNHAKVPDKRNKWVTLNCYRWRLAWI